MRDHRKSAAFLLAGLLALTVLACLPYAPQGPFDARSYARLAGMTLQQHPWTALIEPFFAPMRIIAGAPNFLIAALWVLVWVFVGAGAWGVIADWNRRGKKNVFRTIPAGLKSALIAISSLILLLLLFVIGRVPGWRLVVNDPDVIVADLHTHTVVSHDGLVSLGTNLAWHASCGYNMEAVTEHDNLVAHVVRDLTVSQRMRLPALASGLEVHSVRGAMALGVCRNTSLKLGPVSDTALFAKKIHEECGGAVFILPLKGLKLADVDKLADEGVDGFEIANNGHPGLPEPLRRRLLAVSRSRGLVLLADTDWHGWSGITRTWNVIRVAGAGGLSLSQRAKVVIDKVRDRDGADIIPVVAGYMGVPSRGRAVFSPIVETIRYCMELSAARVISWWVWAWAIFSLWMFIEKKGFSPADILPALLVCSTGFLLILAGICQARQGMGTTGFGFHVGLATIGAGLIAFAIAAFRGVGFLSRRHRRPFRGR
ncbi:MAG: hypothetical protein ACP5IL_02365 [Syntrophobacteraceae bacterium]